MNQPTTYTFAEGLVQAIVSNLSALPAGQTRGLLNTIEAECVQQDQVRAQAQRDEERKAIEANVRAALEQERKEALATQKVQQPDPVQAPAQQLPEIPVPAPAGST